MYIDVMSIAADYVGREGAGAGTPVMKSFSETKGAGAPQIKPTRPKPSNSGSKQQA
jgi:hypothetical protein